MNGERVILAQETQLPVRASARAHVIFSMDLEKAKRLLCRRDRLEMIRLETNSGARWNRVCAFHDRNPFARVLPKGRAPSARPLCPFPAIRIPSRRRAPLGW